MTTQHTPGPWEVEIADSLYNTFYIVNEDRESDEVDHANARLIAAAPELLAALQEARDYLADLLNSKDDEVIDNLINNGEEVEFRLSAAIDRATTNH